MTQDFLTTLLLQSFPFVLFALPIAVFIKIYQITHFRVKYSSVENNTAKVYICRFLKKKEQYSKYVFYRSLDGKWIFIRDCSSLKFRIVLLVGGFVMHMSIWTLTYGEMPNVAILLIAVLLWGVISFTTFFTDPIEAYAALQIDLRKKRRGDGERDFDSLKKVIRAFWQAIENGSEEEVALCYYTENTHDDIVYEELPANILKILEIAKSYESDIIIDYSMRLYGYFCPVIDSVSDVAGAEKACFCYNEVSVSCPDKNEKSEIDGTYSIDAIQLNKRWYICGIHRIDEDEIRQKNQREGRDEE